jgi:tetratricopeptide (TPR) repeat protein
MTVAKSRSISILSQNIKRLRLAKGHTQVQLAEAVGISVSSMSRIENGRSPISSWTLITQFAKIFECPNEALYVLDEEIADRIRKVTAVLKSGADYTNGERWCTEIFELHGHDFLIRAIAYNLLGKLYLASGKFQKAYDTYLIMIHDLREVPDLPLQYAAYLNLALACFYLRRYDQALSMLDKLETVCPVKSHGSEDQLRVSHLRVNIYIETGRFEEARKLITILLDAYRKFDKKIEELQMIHNLGYLYRKQKNYHSAIHYLALASAKAHFIKHDLQICRVAEDLSQCYIEMEEYEKAEQILLYTLKHAKEDYIDVQIRFNLARCKTDPKERLAALQEVFQAAQRIDNPKLLKEIAKHLAESYKSCGEYQEAMTYYELALKISESFELLS